MRKRFGQIVGNESGSAIVMTAVSLPLMIGAAGLTTDVTQWVLWKRQLQRSADSAAIAGAQALLQAHSAKSSVEADLAKSLDMAGTRTVIENAPTAGPAAGNKEAVRVALTLNRALPFSSMFMKTAPTIRAESTAAVVTGGQYCVIALDDRNTTAIKATGSADIALGCGMAANASGSKAIDLGGSSSVGADPIAAVGQIDYAAKNLPKGTTLLPNSVRQPDPFAHLQVPLMTGDCSRVIGAKPNGGGSAPAPTPTPTPTPGATPTPAPTPTPTPGADPKGPKDKDKDRDDAPTVAAAAAPAVNDDGKNGKGQDKKDDGDDADPGPLTYQPGCYADINVKGTVTLAPGVYVIDGGSIKINAKANITGQGVTIILTSSDPGSRPVATIDINGSAKLDLTAPESGEYKGILLYQDRRATDTGSNKINGNSESRLAGAIYFPSQEVEFTGTSGQVTECLQIVARRVEFKGNSSIQNRCDKYPGSGAIRRPVVRLIG